MEFNDEFTENHFQKWLDNTVHWSERDDVEKGIRELVNDHPDLIEKNYSWTEMRRMSER